MSLRQTLFATLSAVFIFGCGGGSDSGASTPTSTDKPAATAQSSVDPATAATLTGSIKFSGAKPKAKKISMKADAYCKGAHTASVFSEEVVVNPNGTLKNVLVFVKSGLEGKSFPTPSKSAVMDQIGCLYTPHVLAVQKNQQVVIRNSDNVLHNVNARPKNNKPFNLGQPVKGMESKKKFANTEVGIPLKCDVHPWMRGYIAVLDHPYSAVTGDDGSFSLSNLPPGTYTIEAWHEKYGSQTQSITVGAKETKSVSFSFKGA